jgi:hypothetical protein
MDANSGFESYTVDAVSLTLKRADGTTVQVLPVTARADFASLADIKELLASATVPAGTYVGGTLRLDFSKASIYVDVSGTPTKAVVVDANGNSMTTVDLDIQLDTRNPLMVAAMQTALLELDLDLVTSNTIQNLGASVQVTVKPSLAAATDLIDGRDVRVRGPLVTVNTAASNYQIKIQPFQLAAATLGQLSIQSTADTTYEINGTVYASAAGLTALAALPAGTLTTTTGTISTAQRTITAKQVYAGSSVAGMQLDAITGSVIARTGNQLTVRGATLVSRSGTAEFSSADATLTVGAGTMVRQVGLSSDTLDTSAVSVGQRVLAFGQASKDANGAITLDATNGRVRLVPTSLIGTVTTSAPGALTLNLQALDGRDPGVFNFAGTGATAAQDADPTNYEVATSNVSLGSFDVGSAVAALGFVTPFGTAPPDFQSAAALGIKSADMALALKWANGGTAAPFVSVDGTGIVIDNKNTSIGDPHYIVLGVKTVDILTLAMPPSVVPDSTKAGTFVVTDSLRSEVFTDFAAFTARLTEKLSGGSKLVGLTATGAYDASTSRLTSSRVLAAF